MNKLASIFLLHNLGLPTIDPCIITGNTEKQIRKQVDAFYQDRELGWVLRCGGFPDEKAYMERGLPWDKAFTKYELIQKIQTFQKELKNKYNVFCHHAYDLIRGGVMLVEGDKITIEAARGNDKELSDMFRGHRDPEQTIKFGPSMMSYKSFGKEILTINDLYSMRSIERSLNWKNLGALIDPVVIEFSRLKNEDLYVHDLSILSRQHILFNA